MNDDRPKKPRKKASKKPKKKLAGKPYNEAEAMKSPGLSALFNIINDPRVKREQQHAQDMTTFMSEFLSAYILIGYTVEGTPVQVTMAGTPQEFDALSTALQRYIVEGCHRGPGGSGGGGLPFPQ
tara:strand:+ start:126 stop:500 length:375 start_codon:yes stop_codon:yes gene_type:complete